MKKTVFLLLLAVLLVFGSASALAQDGMYGESPALAAMVEAGELPPVAERPPAEPLVIAPIERISIIVEAGDRLLLGSRKVNSEHDATIRGGSGGLDVFLTPIWHFPSDPVESAYVPLWTRSSISRSSLTRGRFARCLLYSGDADEAESMEAVT